MWYEIDRELSRIFDLNKSAIDKLWSEIMTEAFSFEQ